MIKTYSIRIRETLAPHWSQWFDGLTITTGGDGETILSGSLPDQAALFGVLARVRDLGLTLLAVEHVNEIVGDDAAGRDTEQDRFKSPSTC